MSNACWDETADDSYFRQATTNLAVKDHFYIVGYQCDYIILVYLITL